MLQDDIFVPHSFMGVLSLGHVNHDAECNNILSFRSVCAVVENGMHVKQSISQNNIYYTLSFHGFDEVQHSRI